MRSSRPGQKHGVLYLGAAILLVVASAAYWSAYAINAYDSFHESSDLGIFVYNMYFYANYATGVPALQYLVFGNHIAPDQLLVMPFFYAFPSPITLLIIQAIVVSGTGLIVFLVARDTLNSPALGVLFCLAYLANPGMHGILVSDYHAEALILPFYLLAFYSYMKLDRRAFIASFVLLLGTIESVLSVAFMMCVGLLVYEFTLDADVPKRAKRIQLCKFGLAATLIVFALYNLLYFYLASSYASGNTVLPPFLRVNPYEFVPLVGATPFPGSGTIGAQVFPISALSFLVYGLIVAFFGFGLWIAGAALPAMAMALPWLVEVAVGSRGLEFVIISEQYFSFVLGGTLVASILGASRMISMKRVFGRKVSTPMVKAFLVSSALAFMFVITAASPFYTFGVDVFSLQQSFLLQTTPALHTAVAQLNSVISQVPDNATLMTDYSIMPGVAERRYLEVPPETSVYFQPKYILVDFNSSVMQTPDIGVSQELLGGYIANHTYSVLAENGSAILYVET